MWDGLRCYVGYNSITCADDDDSCTPDDCAVRAPLFVTIYLVFNQLYNLLIILMLKYGSANLLYMALTLMVPLGNSLAYLLTYSLTHSFIHSLTHSLTHSFYQVTLRLRCHSSLATNRYNSRIFLAWLLSWAVWYATDSAMKSTRNIAVMIPKQVLTHSLTHSLIHSFTHSFIAQAEHYVTAVSATFLSKIPTATMH